MPRESFLLHHWDEMLSACVASDVPEIRISGGEPLLISNINELCLAIFERGMHYTMLTNATLLAYHIEWMSHHPPTTLWISFHREYSTPEAFIDKVLMAVRVLPVVGIHVFQDDVCKYAHLIDRAVDAGVRRIKILSLTPIGRCSSSSLASSWRLSKLNEMALRWNSQSSGSVEVRVETPTLTNKWLGEKTCVLFERPLLSIDHDGAVYPCCVTVGNMPTAIGHMQYELLTNIMKKWINTPLMYLPCAELLKSVAAGSGSCPLRLVTIPTLMFSTSSEANNEPTLIK